MDREVMIAALLRGFREEYARRVSAGQLEEVPAVLGDEAAFRTLVDARVPEETPVEVASALLAQEITQMSVEVAEARRAQARAVQIAAEQARERATAGDLGYSPFERDPTVAEIVRMTAEEREVAETVRDKSAGLSMMQRAELADRWERVTAEGAATRVAQAARAAEEATPAFAHRRMMEKGLVAAQSFDRRELVEKAARYGALEVEGSDPRGWKVSAEGREVLGTYESRRLENAVAGLREVERSPVGASAGFAVGDAQVEFTPGSGEAA